MDENDLLAILARHQDKEGPLLPILHDVQEAWGHIPNAAVPVIAGSLNLSRAEVHGTISFYHDFRRVPLERPVLKLCRAEACQALGTVGDIILADLSNYLAVVKSGGLKTDTSIHLFFDQNATAFRFVFRMNGQPWLSAPIARKNGSNTLSHFVSLDTRA